MSPRLFVSFRVKSLYVEAKCYSPPGMTAYYSIVLELSSATTLIDPSNVEAESQAKIASEEDTARRGEHILYLYTL